jgi:TolA-binding protein
MKQLRLGIISLFLMTLPVQAQFDAPHLVRFYQKIFSQHEKKLQDYLINELEEFQHTFSHSEAASEATFLLAEVYGEKGKPHLALAGYFKTLFLYPDSARVKGCADRALAIITDESAYRNKQEKLLVVLGQEFPINTPADRNHSYLEFLIELDESNLWEYTRSEIGRFMSQFPEDSRIDTLVQWTADLDQKKGDVRAACAGYQKLAFIFPESPLVPYADFTRGILLFDKMDQPEAAVSALSQVVTRYSMSEYASEALFKLGEIKAKKMKNYEAAITDYRKLIADYPQDKRAVFALLAIGKIYSQNLKNYPAAIATYEEMVAKYRSSPSGVDALEAIGTIYQDELKDYSKAAEYYAKIAEIHPASEKAPEMLLKAGEVCEDKEKNDSKAIEYYQLVIDKYPGYKKVSEAQKKIRKIQEKTGK